MQFDVVHEEKLRLIFLTPWRRQVRGPVGISPFWCQAWCLARDKTWSRGTQPSVRRCCKVSVKFNLKYRQVQLCLCQRYCTILTNSSVTGHKAFRSEELVLLSQVTLPFEACDTIFSGLVGSKSFQNWQFQREFGPVTPRQRLKSWSKWYSSNMARILSTVISNLTSAIYSLYYADDEDYKICSPENIWC